MVAFHIATEDRVSEALARRLIVATGHHVAACLPKDRRRHAGAGYLYARLADFIRSCHSGLHFFVLTDLDHIACPPRLLDEWFLDKQRPPSLLLRVAVREAESWLMGDRAGFAGWLGLRESDIPENPESLPDPKQTLLHLAGKSPNRRLRQGLLPKQGAPSPVGLLYNDLLCDWIRDDWQLEKAAARLPSLGRAVARLQETA